MVHQSLKHTLRLILVALFLAGCATPSAKTEATTPAKPAAAVPTAPKASPPPTMNAASPSAVSGLSAAIFPNLEQAHKQGFQLLAGHPPFTVDFSALVSGGAGKLSFAWDFNGDGTVDSDLEDPPPYTFETAGEYTTKLTVTDEKGGAVSTKQRIVVIGPPVLPKWKYGVNNPNGYYRTAEEAERAAKMINALGAQAVRFDITWAMVQPKPDVYDWKYFDATVNLARQHGLEVLAVIAYGAEWARANPAVEVTDPSLTPPIPTEYAWFAYQVVQRYKDRVHAWEIWNEPNNNIYWQPAADPIGYTEVLKNAYLAVKYADPSAVVALGGLGYDIGLAPAPYLKEIYQAGGGPYFDAAARHPYTMDWEGVPVLTRHIEEIRRVMEAYGDGHKMIWITEYSSPASRKERAWQIQAGWLVQSLDVMFAFDYVGAVFWHSLRDESPEDSPKYDEVGSNYGLIEYDWMIKTSYEAYRDYIASHP